MVPRLPYSSAISRSRSRKVGQQMQNLASIARRLLKNDGRYPYNPVAIANPDPLLMDRPSLLAPDDTLST